MFSIDHIGIAVADLDASRQKYEQDQGFVFELHEIVPDQGVELLFLKSSNSRIELLAPTILSSPLQRFLEKRGPGLHHICYGVQNIEVELARLKLSGAQLIDNQPRIGAGGSLIAFIHPKSMGGVLTELCQRPVTSQILS